MDELVALWAWIWSDETYRMLLRTVKPMRKKLYRLAQELRRGN